MTVLVAGGGIGGLAMALTCQQIGVDVKVFESAAELRPLGVGINLQPNAVRELYDLGLGDKLPTVGIETTEWALVGKNGNDIWSEPRGIGAGYNWPQFSVHRGKLQMMLYNAFVERAGHTAVLTDHRLTDYENRHDGVKATFTRRNGSRIDIDGDLLIGADGLHSATRAKMYPDEGAPIWGGAVVWRGTTQARPIRSGACFTLVGTLEQRFVHYPITPVDPDTGLQTQNWLTELTFDPNQGWSSSDWNRRADVSKFIDEFADWDFDWLNVPEITRAAAEIFEYPMVDRDPVDAWVDRNVALMGDAAHVMYPVGSNGGSQAIVDARVIGAKFLEHGVTDNALSAYEDQLRADVSALVLRNRGAGPIAILGVVEERCGGIFDDINDVIPLAEIEAFMANYKAAAGFAIDALNAAPPIITPGSRVS